MAGSYNHIITDQGNLASPEYVNGMLENGGDVFEAVEEMYGMIWWLAGMTSEGPEMYSPEELVEKARQNYTAGLAFAKKNKNKRKNHGD